MDHVGFAFEPHEPFGELVDPRAVAADVAQQRDGFGRQPGGWTISDTICFISGVKLSSS